VRAILIPVKSFPRVKQRLAPRLALSERISLVQAMRADVFSCVDAICRAPHDAWHCVNRVFVVSSEAQVLEEAKLRGWEAIPETAQRSESDSVDFAARWCAARGVTSLLRLPIDLPLITPPDVRSLFAALAAAPSAVLVPSRDGTGTNALLRSPPALFPSRFGPGSLALHLAEAQRIGADANIVRNSRIAFDVDDPEDFAALPRQQGLGAATANWLRERGLLPE
jgi:2-phospho-L-lactate guanylyltransferase